MFKVLPEKLYIPACLLCLALAGHVTAQQTVSDSKPVNFGYSQNPKTRTRPEVPKQMGTPKLDNTGSQNPGTTITAAPSTTKVPPSIAAKTMDVVKRANKAATPPTEIYKVGVGDVLFINLQNAAKASTYYTVLNDGTIDYPLAGTMVSVNGLTVDEIEDMLRDRVKLYENPLVSVKVRDYSSHTINVLGLVEKSGEKSIQREAVPLYVVKAEAVVQPKATLAIVHRADSQTETLALKDSKSDDVLIFPGDIVEFTADQKSAGSGQFYFIGGEIASGGQKDFHPGLTLSQAVMASGGAVRPIKKVIVRRKNESGFLVPTEYSLKNIKDGKSPDPVLQAGDTIEVRGN